jgi:cytoskeletal protein CcmA (bactofilin family)
MDLKVSAGKGISTFQGSDVLIEGIIEFVGTIRLDGKLSGKIISDTGTVIIGEKACIHADIKVYSVIIWGYVKGLVHAKKCIEAFKPGIIEGALHAPVIQIEAGVKLDGKCVMEQSTNI